MTDEQPESGQPVTDASAAGPDSQPSAAGGSTEVLHTRRVGARDVGTTGVADAGFVLSLLVDAATELCIRTDGDEGQFVGFSGVDFLSPVYSGDIVQAQVSMARIGTSSRDINFEARVLCRSTSGQSRRGGSPTAAEVLDEPLVVVRGRGTIVVGDD